MTHFRESFAALVASGRATDWLGGIRTNLHGDDVVFSVRFPSLSRTQIGDGAYRCFLRGLFGGQKSIETGENEDDSLNERPSQDTVVSTG